MCARKGDGVVERATNDDRQVEYWQADHGHRAFDHPVVRFFAQQRVAFIRSLLNLEDVRSALDVGCGSGFSTYYMQPYVEQLWAVDRSPYMLERHPLRASERLALGDAVALPFDDGRFDLVYAWEVLHHIGEPVRAVREMARVSRRYVLLAEPNPWNPAQFAFALLDREHRWVLRYRLPFMRRLCREAGMRVVLTRTGGLTFPNMTPHALLPLLKLLPYRFPAIGISNWVLAEKG